MWDYEAIRVMNECKYGLVLHVLIDDLRSDEGSHTSNGAWKLNIGDLVWS